MRALRALVLVIIFISFACANGAAPAFTVEGFHHEYFDALDEARLEWREIADVPISLDGGAYQIRREEPPPTHTGWTDGERHIVLISPRFAPPAVKAIALHEFGHALHLRHLAEPTAVMNPSSGAIVFSFCDVIECMRAGACVDTIPLDPSWCPIGPP